MYKATGFFPADDRFDSSSMNSAQDKTLWELQSNQSTIGYQNFWPSKMDRENVLPGRPGGLLRDGPAEGSGRRREAARTGGASPRPNELENFRTGRAAEPRAPTDGWQDRPTHRP